jgi:erythromycin esterase
MTRRRVAGVVVAVGVVAWSQIATAQSSGATWIAWTRDHSFPITATAPVAADDYADLQFFKRIIGDRRVVQLGESGHGVGEFDSAKVRLIKFFHEQMGFDVIAFESSLYECFMANGEAARANVVGGTIMIDSIFSVWWTTQTLPLFDYLVSAQSTEQPLTLAGFDSQWSSTRGLSGRPDFFKRVVEKVDESYAQQVFNFDTAFVVGSRTGSTAYAVQHETELLTNYSRLETFLNVRRAALAAAFGDDPSPLIAERTARSMVAFVRQLVAFASRPSDVSDTGGGAIRDAAMADNLAFLLRELYPNKKILVWAHNFHIRHANAETTSAQRTMGSFTVKQFRDDLYTIGLYMYRGQAAFNDRTIYTINPPATDSLEWVLFNVGPPALFVDFLHQTRQTGNEWMFDHVYTREWGVYPLLLSPRQQYDGVLFIDMVTAPSYVPFF